jgi:CHAT domain-containing protein
MYDKLDKYEKEFLKYFNNRQYQEALVYLLKIKDIEEEIYKDNLNHPDLATSYSNLGLRYKDLGNLDKALDFMLKAKDIREEIYKDNLNHPDLATSYSNLGLRYQDLGNLDKALDFMLKAKDIREEIYKDNLNHPDLATLYNNLGLRYKDLGNLDKALDFMLKAKDIEEEIYKDNLNHPDLATLYNNLGLRYKDLGNLDKALDFMLKAKDIFENIYKDNLNYPALATLYNNLGSMYQDLGNLDKALDFMLKAKDIFENIYKDNLNHPDFAALYNNLGSMHQDLGNLDKALDFMLKAKDIREEIYKDNLNHPDLATSYFYLGLMYGYLKELKKYYDYSTKAYDIYIHNRDRSFKYLGQKQKFKYNENNSTYIEKLFNSSNLYIQELNKNQEKIQDLNIKEIKENLFNKWLQYKGSISDFENIITLLYNKTEDKNIKEAIKKREELRKKVSALYHTKEMDLTKLEQKNKIIEQYEKEISNIENNLAQKSSLLSKEISLEEITYENLVPYLKEGELYIDYAYVSSNYYIFTLNNKAEINFFFIDGYESYKIDTYIQDYKEDIAKLTVKSNDTSLTNEDIQITKEILHTLYNLLINDYIFFSNKEKYILSLDGVLGYLPFEALYDGEKYLIENKSISYVPSGKEFIRLIGNSSNNSENIVVFANPDFGKVNVITSKEYENRFRSLEEICELGEYIFTSLPGTQKELEAIEDQFSISSYSNEKATKKSFLQIEDSKIIHCATHAFFLNCPNTENPLLKIGIAFSKANVIVQEEQSKYRPFIATGLEIAAMKLQGTDLVVLSTCDSAIGDLLSSEGLMGLNKAFIQAGTKSVIASLWKANDLQTAIFFENFYETVSIESYDDQINYGKILQSTKQRFIEDNKHPLFWAGFTFTGK